MEKRLWKGRLNNYRISANREVFEKIDIEINILCIQRFSLKPIKFFHKDETGVTKQENIRFIKIYNCSRLKINSNYDLNKKNI